MQQQQSLSSYQCAASIGCAQLSRFTQSTPFNQPRGHTISCFITVITQTHMHACTAGRRTARQLAAALPNMTSRRWRPVCWRHPRGANTQTNRQTDGLWAGRQEGRKAGRQAGRTRASRQPACGRQAGRHRQARQQACTCTNALGGWQHVLGWSCTCPCWTQLKARSHRGGS